MKNDEDIQMWQDPQQRRLAQQVERDEAVIGARLNVAVPPQALGRARRRMQGELARPSRRIFGWGAAASAAAAAAVVLAVVFWPSSHSQKFVAVSNGAQVVKPAQAAPLSELVQQVSQNPTEMLDLMSAMTMDHEQLGKLKVSHEQELPYLDDMD